MSGWSVPKQFKGIILMLSIPILISCGPVKKTIQNEYQLTCYSKKKYPGNSTKNTLLIVKPQAVGGYQTSGMLYINKPYELTPFAHNAWVDTPANMLFPLLIESLSSAHYFYAIDVSPYAKETTYRLDILLLSLHQNFLTKPSTVQIAVKAVLSRSRDNKVIDAAIIKSQKPCPQDTPYGGVIAANAAAKDLTAAVTKYVINGVKRHQT